MSPKDKWQDSRQNQNTGGVFRLSRLQWAALLSVTLLGFFLRIWGLGFGLPHDSRPDEVPNIQIVFRLLGDIVGGGNGWLNPKNFNYGSLYYYLLTLFYWFHFSIGQLFGQASERWVDFQQYLFAYQENPTPFHLIIRSVSAFAATLCVPALFFTARIWRPDAISLAWLSAILFTPCYLLVRNAHFGSPDTLMLLGIIISLALLFQLQHLVLEKNKASQTGAPNPEVSHALRWAGIAIGLSISIKAPAVLMLVPLFWICVSTHTIFESGGSRKILWKKALFFFARGAGWALLAVALTSPWLFLDFPTAVQSILYEQQAFLTYGITGIPVGWQFYPTFALPIGLGFLLYACAIAGIVRHCLSLRCGKQNPHQELDATLLLTLLVFYLGLGPNLRVMTRYALPLLPLLTLLAASVLSLLHEKMLNCLKPLEKNNPILCVWQKPFGILHNPLSASLWLVLLGLVLIEPIRSSLLWDQLLVKGDTRDAARNWIVSHVPPNSPVASGPRLGHLNLPLNYGLLWLESGPNNLMEPRQVKVEDVSPRIRLSNTYDPSVLKALGIRYVVLYGGQLLFSSPPWEMDRFLKNDKPLFHISPLKEKTENLVSRPLSTVYDPMDALFIPYGGLEDVALSGPEIFIFDLDALKNQ
ncbi:MAG: hypothetical protein VKJ04_04640 [Vampirovibrionales bacterium]|nr:hypothetical protein [Vampirovibrionales bacterium]